MTAQLVASVAGFPSCCGAAILHSLLVSDHPWGSLSSLTRERQIERGINRATLAITAGRQRREAAALRRLGYTPLMKFRGNGGAVLTLLAKCKGSHEFLVVKKPKKK